MRTFAFDKISGLGLDSNNSLLIITDIEALASKITERLNFFLGEWFLNSEEGVPYFQEIFEKPFNSSLIVSILNTEIQKEPDVTNIINSQVQFNEVTRKFSYQAEIESIYGSTTVSAGEIL